MQAAKTQQIAVTTQQFKMLNFQVNYGKILRVIKSLHSNIDYLFQIHQPKSLDLEFFVIDLLYLYFYTEWLLRYNLVKRLFLMINQQLFLRLLEYNRMRL